MKIEEDSRDSNKYLFFAFFGLIGPLGQYVVTFFCNFSIYVEYPEF